jgi:hypothetical protein
VQDDAPFLQFVRHLDGTPYVYTICSWDRSNLPRHTFALTIRVPFTQAELSLPAAQKLKHTYQIEDELEKSLKSIGAIHMGHVLSPTDALVVFRSERPAPATIDIKTGFLKKETISIHTREDRDWIWHTSEVGASPREVQRSRFMSLHHTLNSHGDNEMALRPVDFTFGFSTPTDRAAALAELESHGYKLNSEGMWEPDPGSYWFSVVADFNVEPEQMADRCVFLDDIARRYRGEFDGWACPVVTG